MEFAKLEATGNDFILIDLRDGSPVPEAAQVRDWSDRRRGVGFDQALILTPAPDPMLAQVLILNADGSTAEQCGNGMRAIAAWLDRQGELETPRMLGSMAGQVRISRAGDGQYSAELPGLRAPDPALSGRGLPKLEAPAEVLGLASIGNPHLVIRWPSPPRASDLDTVVSALDDGGHWVGRVNIGLVFVDESGDRLKLRVHERGAGPTPACGSGACAAAALAVPLGRRVLVEQPGGRLVIDWRPDGSRVRMEGPARVIFSGNIA